MRTFRSILFLAIIAVALGACAGSAAQMAPEQPVGGETSGGDGLGGGEPVANPRTDVNGAPIVGTPDDGQGGNGGNAVVDDARIIRTGTMDLEVTDVAAAVRSARTTILAMGGYVGASNAGTNGDTPFAEISYRVPSDRWEDALAALRSLGGLTSKVVSEQTQAAEVTSQIVDLEARIRNLQASETAFQGIAARATKISDVLEIQAQLTGVRGQIEQLMAQLKDLNDRAAFATVTARFATPVVAVQVAQAEWEPATTFDQASASLISTLQSLTDAGIWFAVVWLPMLLVLGGLILIGVAIARRMGLGRGDLRPPAPPAPPAEAATPG
jgi:hypothetical protein